MDKPRTTSVIISEESKKYLRELSALVFGRVNVSAAIEYMVRKEIESEAVREALKKEKEIS